MYLNPELAMLKLRDMMTADIISVGPDTPLAEVAELLATEGISGVPVVGTTRVLGVISASDLMDVTATDAGRPDETDDGGAVWSAMEEEEQNDAIVPPFFYDPWMDRQIRPDDYEWQDDEKEAFGERTAADVMTRVVYGLPPTTPADEAARYMLERGIHRVLVLEDGELVGIVTSMDFVRVVAENAVTTA
jgi:CBS domain-containing protein